MKSIPLKFPLLGALFALLAPAAPAQSSEPFRLDRVAVSRFTELDANRIRREDGLMFATGATYWRATYELARPANVPAWIYGETLILRQNWMAYRTLGYGSLVNFQLGANSVAVRVGDSEYWVIEPHPLYRSADGRMVNISTRARIGQNGEFVVAGFVIEDRPRWVLVRGVGPSLGRFGVAQPAPDPLISVQKNGQTHFYNDNWNSRHDAEATRNAAARVGAFPLDENSRDAAMLIELQPGAYTVQVEPSGPGVAGGAVLVEVYTVPDVE